MGGVNVSLNNMDVNLITSNPASTGDGIMNNLSLSYILYPGDIKVNNLSYYTEIGSTGAWGANLVYFNYGELNGYDPTGAATGEFNASEYALTVNRSYTIGNYRLGGNLRYAHSGIDSYAASALLIDMGGVFIHPQADFRVGMIIKNVGVVVSDYTESSNTNLPLDVQIGTSFKPSHMPVRFSFTLYELTRWKEIQASQETGIEPAGGIDAFFRHTVLGLELLINKNVELLFGYNHNRRQELKLSGLSGSSGFSYGLQIGIKAFRFGFSRQGYHIGGISNTFTLTSDLGRWIKKKSISEMN
jgi:hypothetical protein